MKKNFICNFILSGLLLLSPLSMFAQRVDSNLPWSVRMVESEMIRCPESWQLDFQPKLKWDYCHGLELQSMLDVYDRYGNRKIYDYALAYADTMVNADGTIKMYKREEYSLDRINSGKFIFRIYEQTKDEKYKKALALMRSQLDEHPRNADGGFWHKKIYPNQVWLDGIYMGAPFYAEYAFRNNQVDDYADVINQFLMAARHTYDPKNDVYRHACDVSRKERWADPVTGQSKHSWGRAMGWYAMAFVDALDFIPKHEAGRDSMLVIFNKIASQIKRLQDSKTGLWYQVLDKSDVVAYGTKIATNGAITVDKTNVLTEGKDYSINITTDQTSGEQVMTIKFLHEISTAYSVHYRTLINSSKINDTLSNTVTVTGTGAKVVTGEVTTSHDVVNNSGTAEGTNLDYQLTKVDKDTDKVLSGVKFELWSYKNNAKGQLLRTGTTDDKGQIRWNNLKSGKYVLVETAPTDYQTVTDQIITLKAADANSDKDFSSIWFSASIKNGILE